MGPDITCFLYSKPGVLYLAYQVTKIHTVR